MSTTAQSNAEFSETQRTTIRGVLIHAQATIDLLEIAKAAPMYRLLLGPTIRNLITSTKIVAAQHVETLCTQLDEHVEGLVSSMGSSGSDGMERGGIHADISSSGWLQLAPMLGRYARQEHPVRGRQGRELQRQGRNGEIRAGIPTAASEKVRINGRVRIPDKIDRKNNQVIEVKNVNQISSENVKQIKDETDYAKREGYTMTLVVDHRTKLTPEIQSMWDRGEITVLYKELDDNIPKNHQPTPFIPDQGWLPKQPSSPQTRSPGPTGIPVPQ